MTWLVAGTVLPSLLMALVAAAWIRRAAPGWGLVDRPGHRKVHTKPTPLGGGVAIWLGMIGPLAAGQVLLWIAAAGYDAWLPEIVRVHLGGLAAQAPRLWLLVAASTALVVIGLIDDRWGLGWKPRLAIQFLIAAFVVWLGFSVTVFVELPWLTGALSVLWIVGLVNSFNMLDNMDGLSGGVGLISAVMLAAVLLMNPDPLTNRPQLFVGGLLLLLAGSLAGFLWHNRPPARLFMGDAGAYFIGFWLAVCTIMATFTGPGLPRHAVVAPLCVLATPLYDTITVVVIRLREGRSPFEPDKNHFSHRLVQLGMTKGQAVLTVYLTTATCGLGALLLRQVESAVGAAVILLMVACVLALVAVLETAARRSRSNEP